VRPVVAVVVGAAVAGLGGVVLGEYAFAGVAVVASGVLLGLFVAEAALAVARSSSRLLALALAGLTAGGLGWAAWVSTGHRLGNVGVAGWLAVTLGAVAAALRTVTWRTPARSRPEPAPAD
jgi:hypothetical protein